MKNLKDMMLESKATERFDLWNRIEALVDEYYEKPMDFLEDFMEYVPTDVMKKAVEKLEQMSK